MAGQTPSNFMVKRGKCEMLDCRKDTHVVWFGHIWICGQCIVRAQEALNREVLRDYTALSRGE